MSTILVVDDETEYLHSLSLGLSRCLDRFSVMTAVHGEQALEVLKSHDVAVVVTDVRMPVMDGLELLKRMRLATLNTPVLIVSACLDQQTRERLSGYGVSQFVEKPVSYRELAKVIESHLPCGEGECRG